MVNGDSTGNAPIFFRGPIVRTIVSRSIRTSKRKMAISSERLATFHQSTRSLRSAPKTLVRTFYPALTT
jgi:hypothetical protein